MATERTLPANSYRARAARRGLRRPARGLLRLRGAPGRPSEAGLYADGRAAIAFAARHSRDFVLHGYSLASGVAVQIATECPLAALLLEAPFTSIADVAAMRMRWLPRIVSLRWLVRDRYDNLAKIGNVRAPILIYGGDADQIVPRHNSHGSSRRSGRPGASLSSPAPRTSMHGSAEVMLTCCAFSTMCWARSSDPGGTRFAIVIAIARGGRVPRARRSGLPCSFFSSACRASASLPSCG
ncbi:hypothetical protein SAMN05421548_14428 [Paraburkholderia lycopersici]|uniref:Serine aminopeptidase S33 domain-containing protein n=1 Tax=Paraburkholderia lycopersici TaxID=416944 RepID=A0A1G7CF87_9BURK|nr:hypothetical protein SAMN05421548_14428 [Paraburkholderia lycopersici]